MLRRPRNRRKPRPKRSWLPAINWRALGTSLAAVAGVLAAVAVVLWALDQPIETVSVTGRFQRVSPADIERVVKNELHGAGLLSVNLEGVRRAIHTLPWVDAVSVQRAWPRGLSVMVIEQAAVARWGERRARQCARRAVRGRRAPHPARAPRSFRVPTARSPRWRSATSRRPGG